MGTAAAGRRKNGADGIIADGIEEPHPDGEQIAMLAG